LGKSKRRRPKNFALFFFLQNYQLPSDSVKDFQPIAQFRWMREKEINPELDSSPSPRTPYLSSGVVV